jgi:hypothetical protein
MQKGHRERAHSKTAQSSKGKGTRGRQGSRKSSKVKAERQNLMPSRKEEGTKTRSAVENLDRINRMSKMVRD